MIISRLVVQAFLVFYTLLAIVNAYEADASVDTIKSRRHSDQVDKQYSRANKLVRRKLARRSPTGPKERRPKLKGAWTDAFSNYDKGFSRSRLHSPKGPRVYAYRAANGMVGYDYADVGQPPPPPMTLLRPAVYDRPSMTPVSPDVEAPATKENSNPPVRTTFDQLGDMKDSTECSICLSKYADDDPLRILKCKHYFHQECIEKWRGKRRIAPFVGSLKNSIERG